MEEQTQPTFESLECLSCGQEARHQAVVSRENEELKGGFCLDCSSSDEWTKSDDKCSYCDNQASYNLETVVPYEDSEEMYTFEIADVHLVCEDHYRELGAT